MAEFADRVRTKPGKKTDPEIAALKMAPHSLEAEQAVLGGLLLDNEAFDQVAEQISDQDFYRYEHRLIFQAISQLEARSQPFDPITLSETLKAMGELEHVGGEVYLFEIAQNTPSAANIKAYASIVRERSVLRQLIGVAHQIADTAFSPEGRDSASLLDEAERKVFEIAQSDLRGQGPRSMQAFAADAMQRIDMLHKLKKTVTGLETGYNDFDHLTSGLQPSDLVIIAGRPSMGKTTFAMNIAEYASIKSGLPVLVFSMEMPGDALAMRMLSSLGRVDQHKIRTGQLHDEDWPRLGSAVALLSSAKMFVDDTPGLTPTELRSRARRLVKEQGPLSLIVIDYLQLMRVPQFSDNRVAEISEISRSLKALAKELKVPVIALSQLNRSLEQRADKRPVMSDLRESGAIEQDADLIAFIYRDEVYHPDTRDKGIAEIIIAKQRNGPIGKVALTFLGHLNRFENFADSHRYQGGLE